jgi:hypothetical protein
MAGFFRIGLRLASLTSFHLLDSFPWGRKEWYLLANCAPPPAFSFPDANDAIWYHCEYNQRRSTNYGPGDCIPGTAPIDGECHKEEDHPNLKSGRPCMALWYRLTPTWATPWEDCKLWPTFQVRALCREVLMQMMPETATVRNISVIQHVLLTASKAVLSPEVRSCQTKKMPRIILPILVTKDM